MWMLNSSSFNLSNCFKLRYVGSIRTTSTRSSLLGKIKKTLYKDNFYYFSSNEMRQVLQELGAKHEDFENYLQIYQEGTMEINPACHNKFASIRNIY